MRTLKSAKLLLGTVLFLSALSLSSCKKDNGGSNGNEPYADYTIMMYATGGGNLDELLELNLSQISKHGYNDKINFRALVKHSKRLQSDDKYAGTRTYTMTPDGILDTMVADAQFRMDDPDNIANFITETKNMYPAKKYIYIVWNHGQDFGYVDQPVADEYTAGRQSLLIDDNIVEFGTDANPINAAVSIYELEEGFIRSGIKFDLLYYDLCLMNTIEDNYQFADYADYILGAGHNTPGVGGNYEYLLSALESNASLKDAIIEYIPKTIAYWRRYSAGSNLDLTFMDSKKIQPLVDAFAEFSARLAELDAEYADGSQEDLKLDYYLAKRYKFNPDPSVFSCDMVYLTKTLAEGLGDQALSDAARKVETAFDGYLIKRSSYNEMGVFGLDSYSIGVMVIDDFQFKRNDLVSGLKPMNKIYELLKFDLATQWGTGFLYNNTMKNVGYDSSSDSYFEK